MEYCIIKKSSQKVMVMFTNKELIFIVRITVFLRYFSS